MLTLALKAWQMMGGCLDWNALPIVAACTGAHDIESLLDHLILIRDFRHG